MKTQLLNNRYEVLHSIGRGGFGETFLAVDTHMPSARKCVIKQLKPLIPDQGMEGWVKDRFQREAAILEGLGDDQAQIPRLFAYFADGNNFYLVQEWIQGMTLQQAFQRDGVFSAAKVKSILLSLLPVLAYVHGKKIIHRDLKPENIILRQGDNLPVLIDFGAVKEALATVIHSSVNGSLSIGIGTPGYMPSEQAMGRPIYSSDLYSLGLTALYLLTGKSPQDLETDSQTGEFILPSTLKDFDPNLTTTIRKAIRFHPRDRFSTAAEMLQALNFNSVVKTVAMSPAYPQAKTTQIATQPITKLRYSPPQEESKPNWWLVLLLALGVIGGSTLGVNFVLWQTKTQPTVTPSENTEKTPIPNLPDQVFPEETRTTTPNNTTPPPTEETTPPVTEETTPPPTEETTPPVTEETPPPVTEETPPPTTEETTPPTTEETTPPVTEETTPPVTEETTPPVTEETTPPVTEETTPPVTEETTPPPTDNTTPPPTDNTTPPVTTPDNNQSMIRVPIITVGTSKNKIITTLGQPTSVNRGYWGNSQALLYKNMANGNVDLGYIVDNNTGKLRQSEVSFSPSMRLRVIENTLTGLLQGKLPTPTKQALTNVYNRQIDLHNFQTANFQGMIQRNQNDRVYIAVWDSNFH